MDDYGLIIHWGLYSVPAFSTTKKLKMQNGSEWYNARLTEKNTFRPVSGWKETQAFHLQHYGESPYDNFLQQFNIESAKWNPDNWMKLCKDIGASYIILTAKHHDGFCLWKTDTTDKQCDRNIISDFVHSAKKHGIRYGIYYSWWEFNTSITIKFVNEIVIPQINELKQYTPDIWWFDGHWNIKTLYAKNTIDKIVSELLTTPHIWINDRIPLPQRATCRTFEDRYIPKTLPELESGQRWEHINTIGLSWGRNKQQTVKDYKTTEQLCDLYKHVSEMNGRFTLNLGPNPDGSFDQEEVKRLYELKEHMDNI